MTPKQPRALDDLGHLAKRHGGLAAGYRLAGERQLAKAHQLVADRATLALRELTASLAALERAQPMPQHAPRGVATLADGRPVYERRACA